MTADLLRRVEVKLGDQLIRGYRLDYRSGSFSKTVLASVSQLDTAGAVVASHTFDYYDDARSATGAYTGFSAAKAWTIADDGLGVNVRQGEAGAVQSSSSSGIGGHLYVGYNPVAPVKSGSAGVKVGYQVSTSDGITQLQDVDGDGLPDRVFRKNGKTYYRANLSGPAGTTAFSSTAVELSGLPGISKENSQTASVGLEGYAGVASAQLDFQTTSTTTRQYLTDVNADGVTDLVNDGSVLFGYRAASGQIEYSADSRKTPVTVAPGVVSGRILGDQTDLRELQIDQSPLLDSVRRWVAPFAGTIRIDAPAQLVKDSSPERADYLQADGVRLAVQRGDTELWSTRIHPTDYTVKTPTGVGSLTVAKGDALYFRVQSVEDGMYDAVSWDPKITYLGVPTSTDVNGRNPNSYQASQDFTLAGRPSSVSAPLKGTLRVTGAVTKSKATSDDVTVIVGKGSANAFSKVLAGSFVGTLPIDVSMPVRARDELSFRLRTDSEIDATALAWATHAYYTAASGVDSVNDDNGNPAIVIDPPVQQDLYSASTLTAPRQSWTAPRTGTVLVEPDIQMRSNIGTRSVYLTVKSAAGKLVGKRVIQFVAGAGLPPNMTRLTVPVTAGQQYYFDFSSTDTAMMTLLLRQSVKVQNADGSWSVVPSAMHAAVEQGAFAEPYRGWGAVGYQGNRDRADQPIKQSDLVVDGKFLSALPGAPTAGDLDAFAQNPRVNT